MGGEGHVFDMIQRAKQNRKMLRKSSRSDERSYRENEREAFNRLSG